MFSVALKLMLYDKIRSLVTLIGVVFAVTLIFAQLGIYFGLMDSSSMLIDNSPGDIWITSKNCRNFDFSFSFPEYLYFQALSAEGIEWVEKLIVGWNFIRLDDGATEQIEVVGFNPDTGVGGPWRMKDGNIGMVKNGNFAIMDESAKKRFGKFEVGDYREVGNIRLQIVGVSKGMRSITTANSVFTSYDLAKSLLSYLGADNTVFMIAKVKEGSPTEAVIGELRKSLTGVDVYSKEEFSRRARLYWTKETGAGYAFLITILVSFMVGMLIVGQTIYNSTVDHIKEFGTLKALGAENADIYKIILSQAVINALLGYAISIVVTLFSVRFYEFIDVSMVVKREVNIIMLVITFLMCIGAALFSIRKIRKIDPAILFRG